jgi:hypothetical protein
VLVFAAAAALVDASLRFWRPARVAVPTNLLFLVVAWTPFFALPHVGPRTVTGLAALLGLFAMLDFSRAVGLPRHGRFFLPAFILTAACYPVAAFRQGVLLPGVPAVALLGLATASAVSKIPEAFLQKLALAWVAVLVYGYLNSHVVLFVHAAWPAFSGTTMLAVAILLANIATVASLATRRLVRGARIPLIVTPLAGFAGGKVIQALWPAVGLWRLGTVGVAVGCAVAIGLRAHVLILAEAKGGQPVETKDRQEGPRNGSMIFGFGLAVAVGYWVLTFQAPPA